MRARTVTRKSINRRSNMRRSNRVSENKKTRPSVRVGEPVIESKKLQARMERRARLSEAPVKLGGIGRSASGISNPTSRRFDKSVTNNLPLWELEFVCNAWEKLIPTIGASCEVSTDWGDYEVEVTDTYDTSFYPLEDAEDKYLKIAARDWNREVKGDYIDDSVIETSMRANGGEVVVTLVVESENEPSGALISKLSNKLLAQFTDGWGEYIEQEKVGTSNEYNAVSTNDISFYPDDIDDIIAKISQEEDMDEEEAEEEFERYLRNNYFDTEVDCDIYLRFYDENLNNNIQVSTVVPYR